MKKILTAAVVCTAVFMTGCSSTDNSNPKSVLSSFLAALGKGDIAGAKKFATEESQKTLDLMKMMGGEAKDSKYDKSNMEIGEAKIDGDKATISVKDKSSGMTTPYNLKKVNGAWKVAFSKSNDSGTDKDIKMDDDMKMKEDNKMDTMNTEH